MATTRFNHPRNLNDLPEEILSNISGHFYEGKSLRFYHDDEDENCDDLRFDLDARSVLSVQLLNKKLCRLAWESMLKHSTVLVDGGRDVACMLTHCTTLSAIRSLIFTTQIRNRVARFPLIDDFFRALIGVTRVTFHMQNDGDGFYGLTGEIVRSAIDGDAQWTREILVDFLNESGHLRKLGTNPKVTPWVRDILDGNAFTGSPKPPHVQLTLELPGHILDESRRKAGDIFLVFCPETHMLSGSLEGQSLHVKQMIVKLSDSRYRGNRGHLCDASDVSHDVQQTIETILGKPLSCIERTRLSDSEFDYDHFHASRHTKLEAAIDQIRGFNLRIPACFAVIEWLEARKQPRLKIQTLEQAIAMVRKFKEADFDTFEEDLDTFESAAVAWEWQTKASSYSPNSLLELYLLVRPALNPKQYEDEVVFEKCYNQLYYGPY